MNDEQTGQEIPGSEHERVETSQEEAQQDSQLQTEQPDQPVPTEAERVEQDTQSAAPVESVPDSEQAAQPVEDQSAPEPYQPKHPPLESANRDQQAEEDARQAELQAERDEHNERTGDPSQG